MARRRDRVMEELKAIRRKLSERLYRAYQQGKLEEEVAVLEREGERAYREAGSGPKNGHRKNGPHRNGKK